MTTFSRNLSGNHSQVPSSIIERPAPGSIKSLKVFHVLTRSDSDQNSPNSEFEFEIEDWMFPGQVLHLKEQSENLEKMIANCFHNNQYIDRKCCCLLLEYNPCLSKCPITNFGELSRIFILVFR